MVILSLGLILFLGTHLVPTLPAVKAKLIGAYGQNRYKSAFSVLSALGLILIVLGYARAPHEPRLFNPYSGAILIAPLAMGISFILLAAANMKTHIRRWIKHPMLLGVGIWSAVHLLANGNAKASLLFGAFFAYVVIDLISAIRRNATKSFQPVAWQDLIAVVSGVLLALLVMSLHRLMFGVMAVNWGM
jgi:uncharacterized membrane protein